MTPGRAHSVLVTCLLLAAALGAWLGARRAVARGNPSSSVLAAASNRPPGAFSDQGPSFAIFPPQRIPLLFDHRRHTERLGLSCLNCHPGAARSRTALDNLLPEPTICDACHDVDHANLADVRPTGSREGEICAMCHVGHEPANGNRVARVALPEPNLRFDHAAHRARNINCRQCHGEVQHLGLATRDQLPRMRGCLRCHQAPAPSGGEADGDCANCHLTDGDRLKTQFASGALLPPRWLYGADHGPDWLDRHKAVAAANSDFCARCHEESECIECHDGRVRPRRIHPNDWLSLHAMAARQGSPRCSSCHRNQSFCVTCHLRTGVTQSGPGANLASRGRFHPPRAVWTDPPRSVGHHAWEAERNLEACTSCHTERDCVVCHATSAAGGRGLRPGDPSRGVSPHPPGFQDRCRRAFRKNARPCMVCHLPSDPLLGRCR